MKGLLWMGNGFLLLYKRFESGSLSWPRTTEEAAELTEDQYHYLMLGLNPLDPKIKDVTPLLTLTTFDPKKERVPFRKDIFTRLVKAGTFHPEGINEYTLSLGINWITKDNLEQSWKLPMREE